MAVSKCPCSTLPMPCLNRWQDLIGSQASTHSTFNFIGSFNKHPKIQSHKDTYAHITDIWAIFSKIDKNKLISVTASSWEKQNGGWKVSDADWLYFSFYDPSWSESNFILFLLFYSIRVDPTQTGGPDVCTCLAKMFVFPVLKISHVMMKWCRRASHLGRSFETAAELHNSVDLLCGTTDAELHNSVDLLCGTTAA